MDLTAPQQAQLQQYLRLLRQWNAVYNLTAVRGEEDMIGLHVLDCLAVLPALDRWACALHSPEQAAVGAKPIQVLDVGSGGGLPGVVLAVCRPVWRVLCVDTVAKKASFIRQVAAELGLTGLAAHHGRVEAMAVDLGCTEGSRDVPGAQVITARAFSSLPDLVQLTQHLLAPGGVWMAMKGQMPEAELVALAERCPKIEVFHVEQLQVPGVEAQRCLVWMRPR